MSGKSTGLGARLLVGTSDLSGDIAVVDSISGGPSVLDVTDITQSAHERRGGRRDGSMEFRSYFNPAGAHPVLSALPTADIIATYAHRATVGAPAASCQARQVGYDPTLGSDGSLTFKVAASSDGYGVEWGQLLTPGVRADAAATDGATLDQAAETVFGAQVYFQVTAFTGTDATVQVQHSTDGGTWSALASYLPTGPGTYRRAVTGTVHRYVRVRSATAGGFTDLEFLVNLVRNDVAVTF